LPSTKAPDGSIDLHDVVLVPIKNLKKDPNNPNVFNERQLNGLRASMKRFGYLQPIIVDRGTMIIADGEHRAQIYEESGRTEVPCILLDLKDDAERRLLRQTMNKLRGQHDKEKDLSEIDFLMRASRLGEMALLTATNSNDLLLMLKGRNLKKESALSELDADSIVKKGQIWQLGNHRLMCGNSVVSKDVDQLVQGKTTHLCLTDPPYSVELENIKRSGSRRTLRETGAAYRDVNDAVKLLGGFISLVRADLLILSYANMHHLLDLLELCDREGFELGYELIWVKQSLNLILGRNYQPRHESIFIFRRKNPSNKIIMNVPKEESTVLEYPKSDGKIGHPAARPIQMWSKFIQYHTEQGQFVYDPFGGSGTTLIACEQFDRKCLMMEIEPKYCDLIISRWEKFTGRKAELV
jgi:DNA modification methylase